MITFVRVDDRLIHGQVQTKIVPMNSITRIIAIDDPTASNPMLKKIFEAAAPAGTKTTVHTLEKGIALVKKAVADTTMNILVLTRRPETLAKVYEAVPGMPNTVNIASVPMVKGEEGTQVTSCTFLNHTESEACKRLEAAGATNIYFQLFPGQAEGIVYWKDIKNKF